MERGWGMAWTLLEWNVEGCVGDWFRKAGLRASTLVQFWEVPF